MRTLTEKYNGVLKGTFTKDQFLRDARMELPNLVTQHNSYPDAVNILLNKGLISEGMTDDEWQAAKEFDRLKTHPERKKIQDIQKLINRAQGETIDSLQKTSDDTSKMPADRDKARNKMYNLKARTRTETLSSLKKPLEESSEPSQLNVVFNDPEDYIRAKQWFSEQSDFYASSEHDEFLTLSFEVADQADADATERAIDQELSGTDIQSWRFEIVADSMQESKNTTEFNVNKVWDFIESRPFYNKNYMPKFNTAKEIWDELDTEQRQMYAEFEWEDTYGGEVHKKELQNLQRRKNYNTLAGLTDSKNESVNGDKSPEFKKGDKVTYLGHPGEITLVGQDAMGRTHYSVSYNKGQGRIKVSNIYNKDGEIKAFIKEEVDPELLDVAQTAMRISKEEGVVQHVNQISGGRGYTISDFYDSDNTIISFENGRKLNELQNGAIKGNALTKKKATYCGRCGHTHVKGTPCPRPFKEGLSPYSDRLITFGYDLDAIGEVVHYLESRYKEGVDFELHIGRGDDLPNAITLKNPSLEKDQDLHDLLNIAQSDENPDKISDGKKLNESQDKTLKRNDIVRHIPSGVEMRISVVKPRTASGVVLKAGNLSSKLKVGDVEQFRNVELGATWERVTNVTEAVEPMDQKIPLNTLEHGIRFELDKKGLGTSPTVDEYEKAKKAALKNLHKDLMFYRREEGAKDMPVSKTDQMVKMKLKEGIKQIITKILTEDVTVKKTFTLEGKLK